MNALYRFGTGRNDIQYNTNLDLSGKILQNRLLDISSVRWMDSDEHMYASVKSYFLDRFGSGRNDIQYTEYMFKAYIGGIDGFASYYNPSTMSDPYSIRIEGDNTAGNTGFATYAIMGQTYSTQTVSYASGYNYTSCRIRSIYYLIDPMAGPGTVDDFINELESNYSFIMVVGTGITMSFYFSSITESNFELDPSLKKVTIYLNNSSNYSCNLSNITTIYIS